MACVGARSATGEEPCNGKESSRTWIHVRSALEGELNRVLYAEAPRQGGYGRIASSPEKWKGNPGTEETSLKHKYLGSVIFGEYQELQAEEGGVLGAVEDKRELLLLESSTSQSNRSRVREGLSFTSFYAGQTQ